MTEHKDSDTSSLQHATSEDFAQAVKEKARANKRERFKASSPSK